ncbi:MAG: Gfo/Idh/MocA family oxidoreductase [Planctomycetota bacterium]
MKLPNMTRRDIIKASAGAAALASVAPMAYAQTAPTLKVGLIGAGSRGTGAAADIARSSPGIEIVALADLYPEHLNRSRETLKKRVPDSYKVTDDSAFVGLDAYKKVVASDVDIVLCAGYPNFRPQHVEAAVNAGKHVFAEKPIAVDPVGVRRFLKAGEAAKERGLGVLAGTQRRHAPHYQAAVKAVNEGAIGKVVSGSLFFCRPTGRTPKPRREGDSNIDWMLRNWWFFNWVGGGMISQLVIHQIDTMHWVMGGPCKSAYGIGGRYWEDPIYGNIYSNFSVCYEYPDGRQFQAHTRQIPGTQKRVGGSFVGSEGTLSNSSAQSFIMDYNKKLVKMFKREGSAFVQEHAAFVKSIRAGQPLNESQNVADSTLMSIMGQVSAWSGQTIEFDAMMNESPNKNHVSNLDLTPPSLTEGEIPPVPTPVAFKDIFGITSFGVEKQANS